MVQHVQSSPHRPSCRRKVVPLHFVLNPQESSRRFLVEFKKLPIQGKLAGRPQLLFFEWLRKLVCLGHRLREEGCFYYLTENTFLKKFHGSLEPPLGSSTYRKTDPDMVSDVSASRSLVAQTSTESCATGSLAVEEQIEDTDGDGVSGPVAGDQTLEAESEAATETNLNQMIDSTVTLVSNSECETVEQRTDPTLEDLNPQSESPIKKSSKRRFESGTTSIPGT